MMNLTVLTNLLTELRFIGLREALSAQAQNEHWEDLPFYDRLHVLLEAEQLSRKNARLTMRLRQARLHHCVGMETLDFGSARHLSKLLCLELMQCRWVRAPQNILITGATGTGKTYLACALAHQACIQGYTSRYYRLPRLLQELTIAEHTGMLPQSLKNLSQIDVLVLDDWGLSPLLDTHRRYLLELLDDRYHQRATVITSQLPVKHWHEYIGEVTLADAILDRLVHQAQQIALQGASLRAKKEGSEEHGKEKEMTTHTITKEVE